MVACHSVSQGSGLDPVLFILLPTTSTLLSNIINKFADDTKVRNSVLTDKDRQSLQDDLHTMSAWSERWETLFNVDNCQVNFETAFLYKHFLLPTVSALSREEY